MLPMSAALARSQGTRSAEVIQKAQHDDDIVLAVARRIDDLAGFGFDPELRHVPDYPRWPTHVEKGWRKV